MPQSPPSRRISELEYLTINSDQSLEMWWHHHSWAFLAALYVGREDSDGQEKSLGGQVSQMLGIGCVGAGTPRNMHQSA